MPMAPPWRHVLGFSHHASILVRPLSVSLPAHHFFPPIGIFRRTHPPSLVFAASVSRPRLACLAVLTHSPSGQVINASSHKGAEVPDDAFLSDSMTWESMGLSEAVIEALQGSGLQLPSRVQAAAIPEILGGKDVILAAETGSGKTHAYLAPLTSKLLTKRSPGLEHQMIVGQEPHSFALVLCPNATLCQQVADMANALRGNSNDTLLKVAVLCGGQGWPFMQPDLVVATPAAIMNNLFQFDPKRRRRSAFVRDVHYVAEFATSAVDFLHRVGRTGRAGNTGQVTSLYTHSNHALVEAIRQAAAFMQPVERAFSRKRSFRKKLKKQGVQVY